MIVVMIVAVVVIAVVIAIPVPLVHLPALLVVVVVGVAPVGAGVGWPLPAAWNPDIVIAPNSPVALDPGIALSRHDRSGFIADWWRCGPEIDLDLAKCRYC